MVKDDRKMAQVVRWQIGDAALDGPPLAAAIGNFDGVHRGHQKVVAAACDAAKRDGLAEILRRPGPPQCRLSTLAVGSTSLRTTGR